MRHATRTPMGLALLSSFTVTAYFTLTTAARRQWRLATARPEAGESPLGTAVIVAVVLAAAIALGVVITAAVTNHSSSIK